MEKLSAKFGMVSEASRLRNREKEVPFINSVGGQFDVEIQYKGFGIHNLFFFAKTPEMPFYNQYQYVEMYCTPSYCPTPIYRGVPFFQANMYNRFDFYYNWKTTSHRSASISCLMRCVGALIGACLGQNLTKCI